MKRLILALALAGVLASCGVMTIYADPNAYSVKGGTATLKSGERIALVNGFEQTTMTPVAGNIQIDSRQVTDTAIQVMTRHLQQNGVSVDANAPKKVTLKIINAHMYYMAIPFAERWRTNLDLSAALGDGTSTTVHAENSAPAAFRGQVVLNRSVEGATMFAVTNLLNDARFVGYVNK